jgi:2-methylisocitrate lyase-like PEP mutase family enzyme
MNTAQKAERFRALHAGSFVIANAWDAGSAKLLHGLGFPALATSSGAQAGVLGKRDGAVTRDEALTHAKAIVDAIDLPVSADLEKCFADRPEDAARTIAMAAEIGLAGASIEDATGDPAKPLYDAAFATERVAAAVAAARTVGFPFVLTARTESFLSGNPDLADVIRRLQAFEAAGADVLMAPGLPDLDAVRAVCAAVTKPVNFMAGIRGKSFTVKELTDAGREAHQLGVVVVPRGDDRRDGGGDRGEGPRYFHIPRSRDADAGVESVHGVIAQPTFTSVMRRSRISTGRV